MPDEITRWRKNGGKNGDRNYLYFREMFPELDDQIIDQFKLGFGATIIYEDMSREEIGKLIYNAIAIGFVSGQQQSAAASAVWDKAVEECIKAQKAAIDEAVSEMNEMALLGAKPLWNSLISRFDDLPEALRSLKRSDKTESGND